MATLTGADIGGGEGVDAGFMPDETLPDGITFDVAGRPMQAIHTPGHLAITCRFAGATRFFPATM
ncbi:hypothetical protein OKA06_19115 [Novosphingobium sp. MW5]|nr:hypothetical protein [Novosphingobium sp. MW5]